MGNKKKVFFLGVTEEEGSVNRAYSNFVYAVCKYAMSNDKDICSEFDVNEFKRHDMFVMGNIKDSVYRCITDYDAFVVLLDRCDNIDNKGVFNSNVWFELGLASSQDKPIVLISLDENLSPPPFYVNDINIIKIKDSLFNLFKNNQDEFKQNSQIKNMTKINNIMEKFADVNEFSGFCLEFTELFKKEERPFVRTNDFARINKVGFDNLMDLFSKKGILDLLDNIDVRAKFIPSERRAFEELTKEVEKAQKSLRTTRFANQSIVSGERDNGDVHRDFMKALYAASKRVQECYRIICNNEKEKWHDIVNALTYCDKTMQVFIRKNRYSIGFELVIIDEKVAFIHFYQQSNSGCQDSNQSFDETQKINSTLKISGYEVCSKLAKVFDRLHHRTFTPEIKDPSRTLLGVPIKDDISGLEKNGYLQMKTNPPSTIDYNTGQNTKRTREVLKLIFDSFKTWFPNMNFEDKKNMLLGIISVDNSFANKILENVDTYFSDSEKKDNKYREFVNEVEANL